MNAGLRYIVSVVLAIVVTLAAFYLMNWLITGVGGDQDEKERPPGIRFGPVDLEQEIEKRQRRPEPPPPPDQPPPPPDMEIAEMEQQQQDMPDLDLPPLDIAMSGTGVSLGAFNVDRTEEGDVVPLVRIQPQYPREAAINQIEGWVRIEFTITETGSVRNPRVIESQPPRVFDREAIRAILRWKFKPRVVNGQPVERTATQTIDFNLDQG